LADAKSVATKRLYAEGGVARHAGTRVKVEERATLE
jgi:hypothetical protein